MEEGYDTIVNDLLSVQNTLYEYYPDIEKFSFEVNVNSYIPLVRF